MTWLHTCFHAYPITTITMIYWSYRFIEVLGPYLILGLVHFVKWLVDAERNR